jgi:DNA-binding CsgD family transcriptional regulator
MSNDQCRNAQLAALRVGHWTFDRWSLIGSLRLAHCSFHHPSPEQAMRTAPAALRSCVSAHNAAAWAQTMRQSVTDLRLDDARALLRLCNALHEAPDHPVSQAAAAQRAVRPAAGARRHVRRLPVRRRRRPGRWPRPRVNRLRRPLGGLRRRRPRPGRALQAPRPRRRRAGATCAVGPPGPRRTAVRRPRRSLRHRRPLPGGAASGAGDAAAGVPHAAPPAARPAALHPARRGAARPVPPGNGVGLPRRPPATWPGGAGLSPRRRQTLRLLLSGLGEKEIATRLDLSRNTVHHHVKALYRHFHVCTRSELLARWVRE